MSGDQLLSDKPGGEGRQFLPDLPKRLRKRKEGGADRAVRTERELDKRKKEEKWQIRCCRDQQKACRMAQASAEKL